MFAKNIVNTIFSYIYSGILVLGVLFFTSIIVAFSASFLGFWPLPFVGFFGALAWVLVSYLSAPKAKLVNAFIWLGLGAWLAWQVVGFSFFPEWHPKAYQVTNIPIVVTYFGGLIGFLACIYIKKHNKFKNEYASKLARTPRKTRRPF